MIVCMSRNRLERMIPPPLTAVNCPQCFMVSRASQSPLSCMMVIAQLSAGLYLSSDNGKTLSVFASGDVSS